MHLAGDLPRVWFLGALLYLLAAEYFILELVAAAAWSEPAYSWTGNYISDLGVTSCSPSVCSPQHALMNTGLVILGGVISLGSWLLRDRLFQGWIGRSALALMLLSGLGDVLVGTFPGSVEVAAEGSNSMHVLGAALAIVGGNAGILLCGLALDRRHRWLAGYCVISGAVGLGALALFVLGVDLGLGAGGIERLAADPVVIWMIVVGASILIRPLSGRSRDRAS